MALLKVSNQILNNPLASVPKRSDECDHRGSIRERNKTMKTFTIETETNNITLHATLEDAQAVLDSEQFGSAEDLAGLASEWATARLIDIWNGIPGVTPVSKFKDKKTAVTRIWNAIQSLGEETEPGFGDVQECAER